MMPKGVEHADKITIDQVRAAVPTSLMPKGVEHKIKHLANVQPT